MDRDPYAAVRKATQGVAELASDIKRATTPGSGHTRQPAEPVKVDYQKINTQLIRAFVNLFARSQAFRLAVPGLHNSGLTNQQLTDILANQGRDFTTPSTQMVQWLLRELLDRYNGLNAVVTVDDLREFAAKLLVLYCADRVLHGGLDIPITPLTPRYAEWKARQGKGSKPIGVFSGKWLSALRKATVVWK